MAKTQFTEKKQQLSPKRILGALLALVVVFILLTSVISVAGKYVGIKTHIKELTQEHATLAQKHETLSKTNAYLETPQGQEQALRDKYNVVKPGEGMIIVVPADVVVESENRPSAVSRWWKAIISGLGVGKDR